MTTTSSALLDRTRLVRMDLANLGCIGPEGLRVDLDKIVCLVGPNNSGKSTILRAYELALGKARLTEADLCKRCGTGVPTVELYVHIPDGTPNIGDRWKKAEAELRLVRSRWTWTRKTSADPFDRRRETWDPQNDQWAQSGNAGGLDEVFESRLPKPLRVGTLDNPESEHKSLLALVLEPLQTRLKLLQADPGSEIQKPLEELLRLANAPIKEEQDRIDKVKGELSKAHATVFPRLTVDLRVDLGKLEFDLGSQLLKNSEIRFQDGSDNVSWMQQGTGSQRALFWNLLRVRSALRFESDAKQVLQKIVVDGRKEIAKLTADIDTLKTEKAKTARQEKITELTRQVEQSTKALAEGAPPSDAGYGLPGYMLLIDEPEVGLHPTAVRAASKYLYDLANNPSWQVMMTTHSPLFVDPVQDHTTIVRLSRDGESPTPRTYRADTAAFTDDEKLGLRLLNRFDQALAEVFFGAHPVLIEGDTEFAAFQRVMPPPSGSVLEPTLIRARGKQTLALLIRMLRHFKVSFSILHDSDYPRVSIARANPAWTTNKSLNDEIVACRDQGVRVTHRVSVPCFELHHDAQPPTEGRVSLPPEKEKPWNMVRRMEEQSAVNESVLQQLRDLLSPTAPEQPFDGDFVSGIEARLRDWASRWAPSDERFSVALPGERSVTVEPPARSHVEPSTP